MIRPCDTHRLWMQGHHEPAPFPLQKLASLTLQSGLTLLQPLKCKSVGSDCVSV